MYIYIYIYLFIYFFIFLFIYLLIITGGRNLLLSYGNHHINHSNPPKVLLININYLITMLHTFFNLSSDMISLSLCLRNVVWS